MSENRSITITCNNCQEVMTLDNKGKNQGIFSISLFQYDPYLVLMFNCPSCKIDYPVPVKLPELRDEGEKET